MKPLVLDATDKSITAVLSAPATTTEPDFTSYYGDATNTPTFVEGANDGTFNGTTPVTLVAAPAASTRRIVNQIIITNVDTVAVTIEIFYESGANSRRIWYGTLETNETMTLDGSYDENGALKTTIATIAPHTHDGPLTGGLLDAGDIFSAGQVLLEYGGTEANLSASGAGHIVQATTGAALSVIKDNFAATVAPAVTDDGAAGYAVGSYWYDTTADKAYVCLDSSNGAAVWRLISNLLTTKGDILTYSTLPIRLAVGTSNNDVLMVDSSQATGLVYRSPLADLQYFGDGSDGNATISGSTTLTRDMYYNNLTISTGAVIDPAGFRIFVLGTLDITASPAGWLIRTPNNASGQTGGAALGGGTVGGSGVGGTGGAITNVIGTLGGIGDAGGIGGNGGTRGGSASTVGATTPTGLSAARLAVDLLKAGAAMVGGSGGSGGTSSNIVGAGGGGGGGVIYLAARTISRGGSTTAQGISAKGGAGATASNSGSTNGPGGGGGGGGGWVYLVYRFLSGSTATDLITVDGGGSGSGGNGVTNGGGGGISGGAGRVAIINVTTLAISVSVGTGGSAGSAPSGGVAGSGAPGENLRVSL